MIMTKTPNLQSGNVEAKRQEILDYFHTTFSQYESIFECLRDDEAFFVRANALRHPLIFYYGHTATFFINKLNVARLINERIDSKIESSLAIGVDEMSWDDLNQKNYDWPTPSEVKRYRDKVRSIVDRFIRECDLTLPIKWDDPLWVIMMGIEHERIHLETTAVLIRELPLECVQPHPVWGNICTQSGPAPDNELLAVKGGEVVLGKSKENPFYGWDNEYGEKRIDVSPFKASKYLVSNQEFLTFVEAGGYGQEKYWTDEGWQWVGFKKARHPVYWVQGAKGYQYRTMLSIIDMPWDWPVDINYLEAKAFCNWKSEVTDRHIRMPSEAEWMQLRALDTSDQPDWAKAPGNINLEGDMSACPVTRHAFSDGFFDLIGNVWQWTETPIDAYEGFGVHPVYDDFSTPTFDGKHNLFKGGSWVSTGNSALKNSRYAFRRHFFQFAGLRYIVAAPLSEHDPNPYETDEIVSRNIEFHYGEEQLGLPNFAVTGAQAALAHVGKTQARALDIGCAAGRSAFELARHFDHVDAVDFSARLIGAPTNLQKTGTQRYTMPEEGELVSYRTVQLSHFEGYDKLKGKINFAQGDACNLADKYTDYDLVYASNLIDRLYDPKSFLDVIKARIRPGGLLVLASPYTWLEEFTPRQKWLGGFKADTGESYTTLEGLHDALAPEFEPLDAPIDIPFAIRKTRRTYHYAVSQMSFWKKVQEI
jgi:5-histidylcysteine sulfoxide synthase/putative 4-mercaptohistidine N1-methyltranferase